MTLIDDIKDQGLVILEVEAKKEINEHSDDLAKIIIEKLVEVCPVDAIDTVLKGFEPKLHEVLQVYLTKLADKISPKV